MEESERLREEIKVLIVLRGKNKMCKERKDYGGE